MRLFFILLFTPWITSNDTRPLVTNENACGRINENPEDDIRLEIPWTVKIRRKGHVDSMPIFPGAIIPGSSIVISWASYFLYPNLLAGKLRIFPTSNYTVTAGVADAKNITGNDTQRSNVTQINPHRLYNHKDWPERENDIVLIHLETPFNYTSYARPICIPESMKKLNKLIVPGRKGVRMAGYGRETYQSKVFNLTVLSQDVCENEWKRGTTAPYTKRICARVKEGNQIAPVCINKDSGVYSETEGGKNYLIGFVNQFYSDHENDDLCTNKAIYFIEPFTESTLDWINKSISCGSHLYTCSSGQCVELQSVCNRKNDCEDGSDEDPNYCRALNYCHSSEFACGVYGRCIPIEKMCNEVFDCEEGEDEFWSTCTEKQTKGFAITIGSSGIVIVLILLYINRMLKTKKTKSLTGNEVTEFLEGIQTADCQDLHEALSQPYSKKYDIPRCSLEIDENTKLGSGAFGIVFKGTLSINSSIDTVAVKTFKSTGDGDIEQFKSLLCEIKIMVYVGQHQNILDLFGACTEDIHKKMVYLVVEYCPLGNLSEYLKNNRTEFINNVDPIGKLQFRPPAFGYVQVGEVLNTTRLVTWSYEIACGMSYLASRNVTHCDLAARNILLTGKHEAKISDFGLSKHLYHYPEYVKSQKAQLPWRWMAIESLRDLSFSTKSDVWAYGVTLWEIFTLGNVPYGGLGWASDFVDKLSAGLRLNKPAYTIDAIYSVMTDCWLQNKDDRPDFENLKQIFINILSDSSTST